MTGAYGIVEGFSMLHEEKRLWLLVSHWVFRSTETLSLPTIATSLCEPEAEKEGGDRERGGGGGRGGMRWSN